MPEIVGLSDIEPEDSWIWENGQPFDSFHWGDEGIDFNNVVEITRPDVFSFNAEYVLDRNESKHFYDKGQQLPKNLSMVLCIKSLTIYLTHFEMQFLCNEPSSQSNQLSSLSWLI